jgi:hypothetical protein
MTNIIKDTNGNLLIYLNSDSNIDNVKKIDNSGFFTALEHTG